jgi:hypothetical protein
VAVERLPQRRFEVRLVVAGAALALATAAGCGDSKRDHEDGPGAHSLGSGGSTAPGAGGSAGKGGGSPGSGGTVVVAPEAGAGGECQRQVTLQGVTLGAPEPFDLVIVADHSKSLAWSRDELSAGLQTLLTHIEGGAVRIFLLTPTQYGADSAPARMPLAGTPLVPWQDPETGQAYEDAVTTFSAVCTDPQGQTIACPDPLGPLPYVEKGTWSFRSHEPVAVIRPDMTDAEFQAQQAAVKSAILAIGGTGSPNEQPLCTLARYVTQEASALPKNAVFLVISDEDDVSEPSDCLRGFDATLEDVKQAVSTTACSSDCDLYRYTMQGKVYADSRDTTCAAFTDTGELIPGTEQPMWITYGNLPTCDGYSEGTCTDAERADADRLCTDGLSIVSCSRNCMEYDGVCQVDVTDAAVNPCTGPFSYLGGTYANLPTYCAQLGTGFHDCAGQGYNAEYTSSFQGSYSPTPLVYGSDTDELGTYFKTHAALAFASGSYLLEGIVYAPTFGCTLGAGQSYATNLMSVIGDPKRVFSLCDSYAPALDGVVDFAQTLLQTDYTLKVADDEHVTGVVVRSKDGSERSLGPADYTFDEATGSLSIHREALRGADVNLRVEVTSDCRPLVR